VSLRGQLVGSCPSRSASEERLPLPNRQSPLERIWKTLSTRLMMDSLAATDWGRSSDVRGLEDRCREHQSSAQRGPGCVQSLRHRRSTLQPEDGA